MANIKDNLKSPLHPIQMQILNKLIFIPKAKFGQLRDKQIPTDQFTYHLDKLLQLGLIVKTDGYYNLTELGKQFVGTIDTETAQQEKFGKRGVLLRTIRKNGDRFEYLVYKRLKQPFYGYVGFHTGKIRFGEFPLDTAFREFKEETGLTMVDYEFVGVYHQIGKDKDGKIIRDIYLYTFNIYKYEGNLLENIKEEGIQNMWLTKKQIRGYKNFPGFWSTDYKINWQCIPKLYRRYLKLKQAGKWQNVSNIGHETKVYYVEQEKVIEEW